MYLKKDWAIFNLSIGYLYIKGSYNNFEVVYFTNNLVKDPIPFCIYKGSLKQCEKFLDALWAEMKKKGSSGFIDADNLYYKHWLEE